MPVTARLALERSFILDEYRQLAAVARIRARRMLMGPDRGRRQMCELSASAPHYTRMEDFLADVVRVQSDMVGG